MIGKTEIEEAREILAGKVHRTPLMRASSLGRLAGVDLYLKLELFQKTGSFKPRGALNRLANLPAGEKSRGVITVSAGNHAQGLAYAASLENLRCAVVMPATAPESKQRAAQHYGAEVILHEELLTIFERARAIQQERGLVFVHPFDDPFIVAGAGTVGLEMVEDLPEVASVVVGVGGGGLLAGVAAAARFCTAASSRAGAPRVRIVGVEPTGAPTLTRALEAGKPVRLEKISTIADGLAPPFTGSLNLEMARALVDEIVLVSDEEILEAIRLLLSRCKVLAEPAGAAAVAAIVAGKMPALPSPAVAIVSGGNVDLSRLKELL